MESHAAAYWRRVFAAGGSTAVPRWTTDPQPGMAEHVAPIPGDVLTALEGRPDTADLPLGSVLLAAHARVLADLAGEPDVVTQYVPAPGAAPLPCLLSVEPDSWRELLGRVRELQQELLEHAAFPIEELRREPGLAGPRSEAEFDPFGGSDALGTDAVLRVGLDTTGEHPVLRLRYRCDVLDAEAAARIAGYHLSALAAMVADPAAEHHRHSLLSAEELRFQVEGLAGPVRELPDRRFHELFEARVRAHPDVVAAVAGERSWTYGQLNARANQLGRALLARGLRREGVVAVATERTLDWMAAVIAIFKAGGVYLPIEPHLPAERIAATLSRAECRLVLTERGSTATLDPAVATVSGVAKVYVDVAYAEGHDEHDLGLPVAADQLAYIYFTSGSTGEPKGAMCEHAGMLNHLYAKLTDLEIGEGAVVAQIAPQCFDISLWQLISALLVGGRTQLIGQDVVLDVARFVDTLAAARVERDADRALLPGGRAVLPATAAAAAAG